ncbi:hypothetical protein EQM13_10515 [Acidilutibacter cellobiosedens]|uniref:UvrD-like helicase ATP-binding domain-containing protein n=1 Tax=Acidilutibacter cellobiosedens TaxID=2507161 RepID=A0A410QDS4_9FIRM|nr:UvrD-helicase domain-containing protein [Acidilutibacter cellobiosedens]QAT61988.1 hypothetical protein EQM13_10515 [Acidilutibacter cellobiosedens]
MEIDRLKEIEITDEDIQWVEETLGHEVHFDSTRVNIIKNMYSVDIQAFPGSGKTTILVAKLAILAKKWPYDNLGICVLSHTNVAREEIEERLGNNEIGRKLLSYPHFIGTLHSFFDTYVALPWIRSKGLNIDLINTEYVNFLRWMRLSYETRYYLKRQRKNESICSYKGCIGEIDLDKGGETKAKILDVIEKTQKEGYFTFDEMLLYAKQALEELDGISSSIQQRFPILFIDEAQDTDSFQWDLLEKAFNKDGICSIRQGYGDSNQAIYNNLYVDDESSHFPREGALVLNESMRFDSRIAKLANTVALSKERMDGTENVFSEGKIAHTIFLFQKDKAPQVIDEFGQLILNTFSDKEISEYQKEGCHVVGMVHCKKEDTPEKQFPKGIYDYWELYEPEKASKSMVHKFLIQYFRYGIIEFQRSGERSLQVEWISKGLRRLINKAKKCNYVPVSGNIFASLLKVLPDDCQTDFRKMVYELSGTSDAISKSKWNSMLGVMKQMLKLFDITISQDIEEFIKWIDEENNEVQDGGKIGKVLPNHYIYTDKETQRIVDIEFGSIHSVKGRTHLATLVLETFLKTHNMKAILKFLCATPPKSVGKNQKRLRCQYVAMTRARALLCLDRVKLL